MPIDRFTTYSILEIINIRQVFSSTYRIRESVLIFQAIFEYWLDPNWDQEFV